MKYVLATIGAFIMLFGAGVCLPFLLMVVFPAIRNTKAELVAVFFITMFAIAATYTSFLATVRAYSRDKTSKPPTSS